MANDGSSLVANSGDQTLKGNSGPWKMGDQVLSIDSTKSNVEYICVEMADDHPVAKQRAAALSTSDATIATKDATIAAKDVELKKPLLDMGPSNVETGNGGVEDGAVAGIAVACFIGGLLVGAIIISMILCPAARQQKAAITKSTTAGVKVEQVDRMA